MCEEGGGVFSTMGDVPYHRECHQYGGGAQYSYIFLISVLQGDIIMIYGGGYSVHPHDS